MESLGFAGGLSGAQFWRIGSQRGPLVLRRWPREHPTPDRLRFIHDVLAHAGANGIEFVPVPVTTRDGKSFIEHTEHLWELTPWLPGAADFHRAPSVEKLSAAMTALARFHVATADFRRTSLATAAPQRRAGAPSITRRLARLRDLANGGLRELSRAITTATWPELAPLAHELIAALPRAIPPAIARLEPIENALLPLQPCIRDIWHDHVLFTGERVTGLVDFGVVDIDSPTTDIARLLGSLAGNDAATWRTGLNRYSTLRPLSSQELLGVAALDASGTILAGCNWIRWIYIEGRQFEKRIQIVQRFQRILDRIRFSS
jgi:Ser/Thr protein kinase RdoA (MazF antagonist)